MSDDCQQMRLALQPAWLRLALVTQAKQGGKQQGFLGMAVH